MEASNSFENNMEDFRSEIRAQMEEVAGHFTQGYFNMEDLTGSDGAIWQEVKAGTLTPEELREYEAEVKESGLPGRITFLGIINSKATAIFLRREIEEIKKRLRPT